MLLVLKNRAGGDWAHRGMGRGRNLATPRRARWAFRKMGPSNMAAVALSGPRGVSTSLSATCSSHLAPCLALPHPTPSHRPHGFEPFCLLHEFTNPKRTCDWSSQGCPQGAGSHRAGWSLRDLTPPPQPCLLLPPVLTAQAAFHPRMYFELPQEGSLGPT